MKHKMGLLALASASAAVVFGAAGPAWAAGVSYAYVAPPSVVARGEYSATLHALASVDGPLTVAVTALDGTSIDSASDCALTATGLSCVIDAVAGDPVTVDLGGAYTGSVIHLRTTGADAAGPLSFQADTVYPAIPAGGLTPPPMPTPPVFTPPTPPTPPVITPPTPPVITPPTPPTPPVFTPPTPPTPPVFTPPTPPTPPVITPPVITPPVFNPPVFTPPVFNAPVFNPPGIAASASAGSALTGGFTSPAVSPAPEAATVAATHRPTLDDQRGKVLAYVNKHRAEVGAPALRLVPDLNLSAQTYATRLATDGVFSHTDGSVLTQRIEATGYRFQLVGENLGMGQTSPWRIVHDWMHSPDHMANMLDPRFTDAGIGMATRADGQIVWCLHLGQPD